MTLKMIDCRSFRVPQPPELKLNEASPTYVDAWVEKKYFNSKWNHNFKLQFRLRIHMMTKKENDSYGSDYPKCADWLIEHAPKDTQINNIKVDGHPAYTAYYIYTSPFAEDTDETEDVRVVAAIDLDEKHYLAFKAQSYVKKKTLYSEECKYGIEEMREILFNTVKNIEVLGNYSGVLRDIYVSRR